MISIYVWSSTIVVFILIIGTFGAICCFYKRKKFIIEKEGKPSGIQNYSSECYMSSIIQALASSDKLIKQYKKIHKKYPNIESLKYLVMLLQNVNKSDDSNEHLIENTDLLNKLIKSVNLKISSQQDACELLSTFINEIHNDLKKFISENQIELPMKLKILHQFKEINLPNKIQPQIGLSVNLNEECKTEPGDTIENLIKKYFQPEIIDDDPNKSTQLFLCDKPPEVLLLHIQANKWDNEKGKMVKQKYHIIYDEEINYRFDIVKELNNNKIEQEIVTYKIKAVVEHIDGERYVTYRNWRNKWFLVDNEKVDLKEFSNNFCPYIIIYEKC